MKLDRPIGMRSLLLFITLLVVIILYQSIQISLLNAARMQQADNMLQQKEIRRKRSAAIEYSVDNPPSPLVEDNDAVGDDVLYFPIYTQLTSKVLKEVCHHKYGLGEKGTLTRGKERDSDANRTYLPKEHAQISTKKQRLHRKKVFKERVCAPIAGLGGVQLVSSRVHDTGQALRYGNYWLLTELDFGSTVFQFDQLSPLNVSEAFSSPSAIHILPEPFQGTNNALVSSAYIGHRPNMEGDDDPAYDHELIFYYDTFTELEHTIRIQAFHLSSLRRVTRLIRASKSPLYQNVGSSSAVDLEVDRTALWAIYRQPGHTHMTVSKMSTRSLKELANFELKSAESATSKLVNAFISCGVLYGVEPSGGQGPDISIRAIFDFRAGHAISPSRNIGSAVLQQVVDSKAGFNSLSSVQHDPISNSLSVFSHGRIISIPLEKKLS